MGAVSLQEAAELLGTQTCNLVTSPKYKPFHIKSEEGRRNARFDLQGFYRDQDKKIETIEKTKLFIEYLRHIEDMQYKEMSEISGVSLSLINRLNIGYDHAVKIITSIGREYINRFDIFYGWSK